MRKIFSFNCVNRPGDGPLQRILILQRLTTGLMVGICPMPSSPSKGKHRVSRAIRLSPSDTFYSGTRQSQGVPPTSHPDRGRADSSGLQRKQMVSGQEWKGSWDKKTLFCKNSMQCNYSYSSHQHFLRSFFQVEV